MSTETVPVNAKAFTGDVEKIRLRAIKPSEHNPRGAIEKMENYQRLVSSINDLEVLVPIVVKRLPREVDGIKFSSGRRTAVLGRQGVWEGNCSAHILSSAQSLGDLRRVMFHTHMTRENWTAIAQCRALSDMYHRLAGGLRFSEKAEWARKIATETVMGMGTARDRVHVLSWPERVKQRIYDFDEREDSKDIYSYILAIEVSVIRTIASRISNFYDHGKPPETAANKVRAALLDKTITGIEERNLVWSREREREREREQNQTHNPSLSPDLPADKSERRLPKSVQTLCSTA